VQRCLGIDFGTTNTALAVAGSADDARPVMLRSRAGEGSVWPSILHAFRDPERRERMESGPEAIESYLAADEPGRLIQSLKSFLTSRTLKQTSIFTRLFDLEDLVAQIVRDALRCGATDMGGAPIRVVVGRPVRFAGGETGEDDAHAAARLEDAMRRAGVATFTFLTEPEAAAHEYRRRIRESELALIADFGGGTTDFCLAELGAPGAAAGLRVLGVAGVGVAGDVLDARLVENVVAPELGEGTLHVSTLGKSLPAPAWLFDHLRQWHHVSFLRSKENLAILRDLAHRGLDPHGFEAFLYIVEQNRGFHLHQAVQACKLALSRQPRAELRYEDGPVRIRKLIPREAFEAWIAPDLARMGLCLDGLMADAQVRPSRVASVFMTGGSSLVPAVRRLMASRFGEERLRAGNELTSVASGLAASAA
jgi:hypothetical chaperone protein